MGGRAQVCVKVLWRECNVVMSNHVPMLTAVCVAMCYLLCCRYIASLSVAVDDGIEMMLARDAAIREQEQKKFM